MFDDKKEPVDIFADVDKAPPPGSRPSASSEVVTPPVAPQNARGPSKLLLGIILLVIVGLGAGGYYLFVGGKKAPQGAAVNDTGTPAVNEAPAVNQQPAPAPAPAPTAPVQPPDQIQQPVDSDGDGLSDAEEAQLGTDPQNTDTDHDGLTDYEEVRIYHTDPKNPDTDGDGFLDGQEVKGGYNPNGPGKLFGAPAAP